MMVLSVEQISKAALALPNDARAELAHRLVNSLEPAGETGSVDPAWAVEALRRRDEVRNESTQTVPADVVVAHLRDALK